MWQIVVDILALQHISMNASSTDSLWSLFWDFGCDLWSWTINNLEEYSKSNMIHPGPYSTHAPGAMCTQIILLEHIWLKIFFQIIYGTGPWSIWSRSILSLTISRGQNLKKAVRSLSIAALHEGVLFFMTDNDLIV